MSKVHPDFIHVLVSGPPASGKSTLLQYITAPADLVGGQPVPRHVVLWHGGHTVFRFSPRGRSLPKAYEQGTKRSIRVDLGIDKDGMQLVFIRRDHIGAKPFERRLYLERSADGEWGPWWLIAARAVLRVIAEVDRGE